MSSTTATTGLGVEEGLDTHPSWTPVIEPLTIVDGQHVNEEHVNEEHVNEQHVNDQSLERTDGGYSAWRFLCAAFVFEAVLWGFPLSFGIFQDYYTRLPQFSQSPYITYIGTISTGITYIGAPLMLPFIGRYPKYQRHMIWGGWVLCICGLLAGSFADTATGLIMTQGVLYGTGYLIVFYPIVSMMNEWWVARRGFAWGIMLGASGASGVVFPFIIQSLLARYGYKTTLGSLTVATTILTGPLLPLFKKRLPPPQTIVTTRTDWAFLRKPLFWLYVVSTVAQSLGFYLPALYLPSYASSIGSDSRKGALLLALMSVTQVLGQLTYGYLSDGRVSLNLLLLSSSAVAAISSFTLWGLARSLPPLVCFGLVYGFFAYSYMAMRVRMGTMVSPDPTAAMTPFSIFSFAQGIGNILAGPISASLLSSMTDLSDYGYHRYKGIIVFTGSAMVLSVLIIGSSYVKILRQRL
ncbi:hypothetical protein AAFC00_007117 [Neodothiora populina]|uniref:MFS general substrate transporter n=1 Tax=Neodothiora populina TaxID=2781224 RepID=A0ABR3PC98_9PEZI